MYDDFFRQLEESHAGFHYHTVISRPEVGPRQYVDQYIIGNEDPFHEFLTNERTLLYVCGIEGMQWGIYRLLEQLGVADSYLSIPEDLGPLSEADAAGMKKIRPADRCMIEVY